MRNFLGDFLRGLRLFRRDPLVSIVVCVTVAAGIAAMTTTFTLLNAFFFEPLPFANAGQLVHIARTDPTVRGLGGGVQRMSAPDFLDFRRSTHSFTQLEAYTYALHALTGKTGESERTEGASVTPDTFALLGTSPSAGRALSGAAEREVVISDGLWRERFGGGDAVGQTLMLDGTPYTVVGVMPPEFEFPMPTVRFWIPMDVAREDTGVRDLPQLEVVGRLRPNITLAQARVELERLSRDLERVYPDRVKLGVRAVPIREGLLFFYRVLRAVFTVLFAAAVFVLLIACTTISGLLLARASRRSREMAVRASLGATRRWLVSQVLTEHFALAVVGAIIGIGISVVAAPFVGQLLPAELYRPRAIAIDGSALIVAVVASVVSTLLFGLGPALHVTSGSAPSLHEASHATGEARRWGTFRAALIVGEVAACILLLSAAGLMLGAVYRMQHAPLGFDPGQVLTARVGLKSDQSDGASIMALQYRVLHAAKAISGVQSAALVAPLAFTFDTGAIKFTIPERNSNEKFGALAVSATADYFSVMRLPLKSGRLFTDDDRTSAVVINELMAARFWPGQDPIGKHISDCTACADSTQPLTGALTIVGVVGNARQLTPWQPPEPTVYVPILTRPHDDVTVVIRTAGIPTTFAPTLRRAIEDVDRRLPVWNVRTMQDVADTSIRPASVATAVVGLLGSVALLLVILSLYGLLSTITSQRARELAVRMALGARPTDVVKLVMRRAVGLAAVGLLIGELASLGVLQALTVASRSSASAAPVAIPANIGTIFAAAAVAFLVVVAIACGVPALRAARLDPVVTLREE